MKAGQVAHLNNKDRGQAMVEFVISLPILLFVLFGIIEFARMTFAWMAVQNAARFGIRYAVTGEFDEVYCVEAGNYLGATYINADKHGGDPQDCIVPDSYTGADSNDLERELIDHARLFSIQDAAIGGGTGLWLRPNVAGNYEQYLANHNAAFIGFPAEKGFYHITVCSNRNNQFAVDYNNYPIPLCLDLLELDPITMLPPQLMDDAGGPGDRVKIHVEHEHPLFLPLLTNIWPSVTLRAERDGIVEKFRTSRVIGVSGPILSAATWTQTPTITPTPTETSTPTLTLTPTITETPIPVDCDKIIVEYSAVEDIGGGNYGAVVQINNTNPVPIHLFQANVFWEKIPPSRTLWSMQFNGSFAIFDDGIPDTTWDPLPPVFMADGAISNFIASFKPVAEPVQGNTSVDLIFDDNCHKGFTANLPTSTPTYTPTITETPTVTPTPDCSKYSMTGFTFTDWAQLRMTVFNGDVVDTRTVQLTLNWDNAESFASANGFPNMNVDWFSWGGVYYVEGQDGTRYYSSPTSLSGNAPFNAGSSYLWKIDFDGDWAGSGSLAPPMNNNDFGFVIEFQNGCILSQTAIPRTIATWTPTPTPTNTWTPTPPPPPTDTAVPTDTPPPTNTPPPTRTFTPSWTPTITLTPSNTPVSTNTPFPTNTDIPTDTPIPPTITNTPVPTDTRTPTITYTPTNTPIPTWTPKCPPDDPQYPCQPTWTPIP